MKHLKIPSATFLAPFALTELIYLVVFTLPFPLARFFAAIPPVDYAQLTGRSAGGLIAFALGLALLFALYAGVLQTAIHPLAPYGGLVFALTLFFSYPVLAIDLFVYAIFGRGWGLYGLNPLATPPAAFPPRDPWLGLAAEWVDAASPYGPLWEVISLGTFRLSGGNFLVHLFALKGVAILSYGLSIFLTGAILARLRPEWKTKGMLAFAWNPLVLLETAQNGHNDMVMVALMLAAVWALAAKKHRWVMPLLALSALVKFVTALIAPLFILYLALQQPTLRRRLAAFPGHSLLFAAPVILLMLPLWPGWDHWAVLQVTRGAGRSLLALLVLALREQLGTGLAFTAGRLAVNGLWAGIVLFLGWRNRRRLGKLNGLFLLSWAVFFWYALLAAPVFHAWYILWSLPLAIFLLPKSGPFQASLVFSFTALLIIPYFETLRVWYPALMQNQLLGHALGLPLLLLPPAIVALRRS